MIRKPMLSAALLGLALGPGPAPAKAQIPDTIPDGPAIRISAVTQPLPTMPQFTRVDVPYLREQLVERSNGRITMQLSSHAERNLGGAEIVRLVRAGQVDIGAGTLSTLSGDVPILDGVDLSGISPDIGMARRIAAAVLPAANRDLERFGVRVMVIYPFPAQVLFCRESFTELADLRGRKVRTFGNSLVDLVTALGGQPVSIGFPEVYSALERGVADCAVTGTGSGAAARWPEVSSYISDLPLSWSLAGYMVNLNWWNGLDPEVRAYLEATFEKMGDELWELGDVATRDGIACATGLASECELHPLAERPMTEVRATQADRALVRDTFRSRVLPGWVKRCGARCGELYNALVAPVSNVRFDP